MIEFVTKTCLIAYSITLFVKSLCDSIALFFVTAVIPARVDFDDSLENCFKNFSNTSSLESFKESQHEGLATRFSNCSQLQRSVDLVIFLIKQLHSV